MKHKRPPIPVIVIAALVVLIGGYFGIRALLNRGDGALSASGTIEAVQVSISPELSGKVAEVKVDEGAAVHAGDELFRQDDTLLQAQRAVSAANLSVARAAAQSANIALATARAQSAGTRTDSWRLAGPTGYTLPGWYFGDSEEVTAAQAEAEDARAIRDGAQDSLNTLLNDPANADFLAAEHRLIQAKAAFIVAQDVLDRANSAYNNADLRSAAQDAHDTARTELDDAQVAYDDLADTDAAKNILTARAGLAVAQERYETAQDRLLALQSGISSSQYAAAESSVQRAEISAQQASLAVDQAQASLALIDAQIAKLTVTAPADGVVLTRSIEPGEVVAAGSVVMTLGRLDNLTITVYVPEDLYGELSLGQSATVSVDSFPAETFTATVTHIADQAEFTPRNVQTVQGRKTTVFAIRLKVEDLTGRLKPGMPADVVFEK